MHDVTSYDFGTAVAARFEDNSRLAVHEDPFLAYGGFPWRRKWEMEKDDFAEFIERARAYVLSEEDLVDLERNKKAELRDEERLRRQAAWKRWWSEVWPTAGPDLGQLTRTARAGYWQSCWGARQPGAVVEPGDTVQVFRLELASTAGPGHVLKLAPTMHLWVQWKQERWRIQLLQPATSSRSAQVQQFEYAEQHCDHDSCAVLLRRIR